MVVSSEKVRRIDYSPDEMIAGVAGQMSAKDFGVYWMVCTLIYSTGEPIPDDHVWIAGIFTDTHWREIRASLDRLIASGKVEVSDGHLMVKRCARELQDARKRIASYQQRGRKGGRPSNKNKDLEKARVSAAQPPTINHQHQSNKKDSEPSGETESSLSESEPSVKRGANDAPDDDLELPDFLDKRKTNGKGESYAWTGRVIRLTTEDLDQWRANYPNVPDFEAELQKADDYYADQPPPNGKWFFPVSKWMERAHRDHSADDDPRTKPEYWDDKFKDDPS